MQATCRGYSLLRELCVNFPHCRQYGPTNAYNGNAMEEATGMYAAASASSVVAVASPAYAALQLRLDRVYSDIVAVQARTC